MKSLAQHQQDVLNIQKKFKDLVASNLSKDLYPSCSNVIRKKKYFSWGKNLGLDQLDQIIEIDAKQGFVLVEPSITIEEISRQLLAKGWMLPIVPEFKSITIGGAINGAAIESSSLHFGQLSDSCLAYEVLLGNGEVIQVSSQQNSDLFYGLSGSYATLGLILLVKIKIMPALPWINLKISSFSNLQESLFYIEKIASQTSYLEGIIFSSEHIKVIEGIIVENPSYPKIHLSRPWSPWYYQFIKKLKSSDQKIYSMTLLDYFFRHDRGAFWMGSYALHWTLLVRYYLENRFGQEELSNHLFKGNFFEKYFRFKDPGILFRTCIGSSMKSKNLYKMLHANSEDWFAERFIIQDYYLPLKTTAEFIQFLIEQTSIFPLWLCPVKPTSTPQLLSPHRSSVESLMDVGVYGMPSKTQLMVELNQQIEAKMYTLNGKKMLYSYCFDTSEQFWEHYEKEDYQELIKKYHAQAWPQLETKLGLRP